LLCPQDWGIPALHYHFVKLGTEIQMFYGLVGTLLGLLLSFRITFSMGRWSDGMVAEWTMLACAKQIITQCEAIDDAFSPVSGQGNPEVRGPHKNAFCREWACMKESSLFTRQKENSPSPELPRFRRSTKYVVSTSNDTAEAATQMSSAAGTILRIRHLTLAVCELTGKHVRYEADLSDLKAKGRFDDITYQVTSPTSAHRPTPIRPH
jgi:hypothetical protein